MSSYISLLVHFVWSTKDREPLIRSEWQDRMYGYLGGILEAKRGVLLCAGGVADHVHLLTSLPSTISLADTVNVLKSNSSRWIHETFPNAKSFAWQEKYGAFSVSRSSQSAVEAYIRQQEVHHRARSFQDEFHALLEKHGIHYDEKFIWR